jgi:serine/threonine protein kinase
MIYDIGDHPNLVRVLPFKCRSDTKYYIFMEYCDQGTLQQQIKQKLIERDHFT